MVGASMGGYAAIRAGLALKARMVLAFSPQVGATESRWRCLLTRPRTRPPHGA